MDTVKEYQEEVDVLEVVTRKKELVLHNDDVNTFDFVIDTLVELCDHSPVQAEQCTFLVHYAGKCSVKNGSMEELKPICSTMLNRGLSAEIK